MNVMKFETKKVFTDLDASDKIFASILRGRGITTKKAVTEFLRPSTPALDNLLKDISVNKQMLVKANKIIKEAIKNGDDICVFGDYDADGITSTSILWQTLTMLGSGSRARILPFIPDRTRHGYGLSTKAVTDIFDGSAWAHTTYKDFQPKLIITVDNGIVANDVVKDLKSKGLKVIITDHHQPGLEFPPCDVLVHSIDTSGAGISWLLSLYLSDSLDAVSDMIDLACIGIVADQIPLTGVNRAIVASGLKKLRHTNNLGLKAMLSQAGIEDKSLTTYDVNYIIAPRINAVGRIDNPLDGLRLLCSKDTKVVKELASTIEKHNINRQALTDSSIKSALKENSEHKIVISASKEYHEGIIGLVAGKLVESHTKPALVISTGELVSKGSARSLGDINITDILRNHSDLLLSVGGHQLAGGFSLETKNIPAFIKAVYEYADSHIEDKELEKKIVVDGEIRLKQATKTLAHLLSSLEPFGIGNFKPKFISHDLNVVEDRVIGKTGKHRKLVVEQDGETRDVIWFNGSSPHKLETIKDLVYTIEINVWRDKESVQLSAQYVEQA